jgi:hypothetical protein
MASCSIKKKHRDNVTLPSNTSRIFNLYTAYTYISVYKLNILACMCLCKIRDSSVGIALGYGLDERGSRVRFPAGAGNFSLHHRVRNGSGAHPASYPIGTRGSFSGSKAAGA